MSYLATLFIYCPVAILPHSNTHLCVQNSERVRAESNSVGRYQAGSPKPSREQFHRCVSQTNFFWQHSNALFFTFASGSSVTWPENRTRPVLMMVRCTAFQRHAPPISSCSCYHFCSELQTPAKTALPLLLWTRAEAICDIFACSSRVASLYGTHLELQPLLSRFARNFRFVQVCILKVNSMLFISFGLNNKGAKRPVGLNFGVCRFTSPRHPPVICANA
jgi:hypothetical protein